MKYVKHKDIHLSNALCFKSMYRHLKTYIVSFVSPSGTINKTAELMISCQKEHRMCTESKQTHRVQQQDHSRIRRMEAVEEASHEEKEVLAKVADQSLVIIVESQDTMLGTVKTPLLLVTTANLMTIP